MGTKQPEALILAALIEAETWPGELSIATFAARSATELRRLAAIEAAARKVVTAKGRYHTEQNYRALEALIKGTP